MKALRVHSAGAWADAAHIRRYDGGRWVEVELTPEPVTGDGPLPAPTGLTGKKDSPLWGEHTFTWDPVPGATGYAVAWSDALTGSVETTEATHRVRGGLDWGRSLTVTVCALGPGGKGAPATVTIKNG
ncbi:hypothetical protein ABT160_23590 [Streptomyces sp. NPDC001941]|uniref:hypothetical protein n=1 Tax=Streptomyces sp. NPDC001941 TaxID=3154659 RepID=UPI003316FFE8